MKNNVLILALLMVLCFLTGKARAEEKQLFYQVEKGDTFGTVIFSLGYIRLWSGSAYVNKFKNRITPTTVNKVAVGDRVYFNQSEIIFTKNVNIEGNRIFFKKKIRKLKEWKELMAQEENQNPEPEPELLIVQSKNKEEKKVYTRSRSDYDLYVGGGAFMARDVELDRASKTTTMTGFQPMVQLKGIYSHSSIGSLAIDVLAKKIFNKEFSFPVNTDFRLQYIPKWIDLGSVNLAASFSTITHSYVGIPEEDEKEYTLKANFLGLGVVLPKGSYWYEIYIEKAISSTTKSDDQTITLDEGWRLDSELIYPLGDDWRLIPGINYYTTKSGADDYQMTVLELRTTIAVEF